MRRSLCLAVLFLSSLAFGQGVRYENHPAMKARADGALVAASVTVAVCGQPANTSGTPCSPLATLYTDATLATPCTGTLKDGSASGATNCSNPLITDSKGNYHFYVPGGTYTIQVYGSGIITSAEADVTPAGALATSVAISGLTDGGTSAFKRINGIRFADQFANIQAAITDAGTTGAVLITPAYSGSDSYSNPNSISIVDLRHGQLGTYQFIRASYPANDANGLSAPLGNDIVLDAQGAADVQMRTEPQVTTSSTSVGGTGKATITVGNAANFYSAATLNINLFASDQEFLTPETAANCGTDAIGASKWCPISTTQVRANFAKTHTVTPYNVDQRGGADMHAAFVRQFGSNNTSVLHQFVETGPNTGFQWTFNAAVSKLFQISTADNLRRFYGDATNGFRIYASDGGAGSNPLVTIYNNETDNQQKFAFDTTSATPVFSITNPTNSPFKIVAGSAAPFISGGGTANLLGFYCTQVGATNCGYSFRTPNDAEAFKINANTTATSSSVVISGNLQIATGVSQGGGHKHQRFGATTATTAVVGNIATTVYTWTTTFADANYSVSCSPDGAVTNVPAWQGVVAKSASQVTVSVAAITAAAASFAGVDCIADHD